MIIGIDIDDTITNTTDVINEYKINYNGSMIDRMNEDAWIDFCKKHLLEIQKKVTVKDNSREVIDYLRSKGYKIYLITLRKDNYGHNIEENTLNYLQKNHINYDKIIFGARYKWQVCKDENISLMIDDNEVIINECITNSVKCLHFGKEVNDWIEIKNLIEGGLLDE